MQDPRVATWSPELYLPDVWHAQAFFDLGGNAMPIVGALADFDKSIKAP